jgi:acyl-CoA synthetase (AMP-forming)/AMP-acid ligase II
MNIATILINTASKYPNKIGFIENGILYSWNSILTLVYKLANYLIYIGAKSGDKIGIDLPNGIYAFISWYAISLIGCISVPIGSNKNIISNYSISIVINKESFQKNIKDSSIKAKIIEPIIIEEFCIINTSGTTGKPKGVLISNKNIMFQINNKIKLAKLNQNTKYLHLCSHIHVAYFSTHAVTKVGGLHVFDNNFKLKIPNKNISKEIICGKKEIYTLSDLLNKYQITLLIAVPAMIWNIDIKIDCLKTIITGGGILPEKIKSKKIYFPNSNWYHTYGSTECSSSIANMNVLKNNFYIPIKNTNVYLKDNNNFIISGDHVAIGYFINHNFIKFNGIFNSSDIGEIKGNNLFFKCRNNNIIKTAGKKVDSLFVSNTIKEINKIIDCKVIGIEDDFYGEKIICNIWSTEKIAENLIKSHCKKKLLNYMIPKEFNFFIN